MGARTREGDASLVTDINVTPLVDVVLVLLVLMMVTATAIANKTIALEAPKARSGAADGKKKPLVVSVDEEGKLYLGDVPAGDEQVRTRARELTSAGETEAVLAADGRARHAAVVHAMDILRSERVSKIAVVVRSEEAR